MITAQMLNLSSCSWIDMDLLASHIYIYIIYQTMLQAKVMDKFHTDNSLLPIQIVAILPCRQSLLMPPLLTETFLLRPKRINDSKMVRKNCPVASASQGCIPWHFWSIDIRRCSSSTAGGGGRNKWVLYCTAMLQQGSSLLYRQNQDMNSLALSIQRCPEGNWIFVSAFSFSFLVWAHLQIRLCDM